jgi:hypothetical protein
VKICTVVIGGIIRWNVTPADPIQIPLQSLPGWTLIHPLLKPVRSPRDKLVFALADGCYHIHTSHINFRIPDNETNLERIGELVARFLGNLRIACRQANMDTEAIAISGVHADVPLDQPAYPIAGAMKGNLIGSYRVRTAVTAAKIVETDGQADAMPIFHEILLDALEAIEASDFRKAILYGAIAMESLARTCLDIEYAKALASAQPPAHLNICRFPQAGGAIVTKDPVFVFLFESDSFGRLLHETPLYLTRRSLLIDNQDLYRGAIKLYKTRNRIGHGVAYAADEQDLFELDRDGAYESLAVVISVANWFGVTGYELPLLDSVPTAQLRCV